MNLNLTLLRRLFYKYLQPQLSGFELDDLYQIRDFVNEQLDAAISAKLPTMRSLDAGTED